MPAVSGVGEADLEALGRGCHVSKKHGDNPTHRDRVLRQAHACLPRGWHFVPIPRGQKGPRIKGWPDLRLTRRDLSDAFDETDGIGLILGEPSNGLVDVDLDCVEATAVARSILPATRRIHGRKSKPLSHWWFRVEPIPAPMQFLDVDGSMLVELRSTGQQTVIPPSIHPSGERFSWKMAGDAARIDASELRLAVGRVAACALLARRWPERGQRHECSKALAGMLLRAGWSEDEVITFITEAAKASGRDEEWGARKGDALTTSKKLSEGRPTTGTPRLVEILGQQVVGKLSEWLGLSREMIAVGPIIGSLRSDYAQWPEPLRKEALQGLPGEIVSAIEPHSEADPASLLGQTLVSFGNAIGKTACFRVESDFHFANLFVVLVGETSKARKGISWTHIRNLFRQAAPDWADNCIQGGLSTGEGLVWAVRDPIVRQEPANEDDEGVEYKYVTVDEGVEEKRLLAEEPEFAQVLKLMGRETNILSTVVRQAWDFGILRTLTKASPGRATGAHISMIGHITQDELRRYLTETEQANGFGNRFLWLSVRRSKSLPEGGHVTEDAIRDLVQKLERAVEYARTVNEMKRSDKARRLWFDVYADLSEGRPGLLGALTSRAEAQVTRLSMVYALMDRSRVIRRVHLEAALALWAYVEASARFIFGEAIGDPLADEILQSLRRSDGGMTRTEISHHFQRHRSSADIARALGVLLRHGRAVCRQEPTDGRPEERWHALGATAKLAN
jgi:Bifunctional DNA primase/polymerase, N-terminal